MIRFPQKNDARPYVIQVKSAAWYVKFTDKIFEKPSINAN